ncbi:hypothetical protein ACQEVF_25270 [Nonomuraea polychroma]|uniref:hypothetical protein n=1 Tax=Nonomuraea polychroma TaxID=46176 RepID=UPI003D94B172
MSTAQCDHVTTVPVESAVTGEILAALCLCCDAQLPAEALGCPHHDVIGISTLSQPTDLQLCNQCGTTGWFGTTPPAGLVSFSSDINPDEVRAFAAAWAHTQQTTRTTILGPPMTITTTTP